MALALRATNAGQAQGEIGGEDRNRGKKSAGEPKLTWKIHTFHGCVAEHFATADAALPPYSLPSFPSF